jgi:hypothetical protein
LARYQASNRTTCWAGFRAIEVWGGKETRNGRLRQKKNRADSVVCRVQCTPTRLYDEAEAEEQGKIDEFGRVMCKGAHRASCLANSLLHSARSPSNSKLVIPYCSLRLSRHDSTNRISKERKIVKSIKEFAGVKLETIMDVTQESGITASIGLGRTGGSGGTAVKLAIPGHWPTVKVEPCAFVAASLRHSIRVVSVRGCEPVVVTEHVSRCSV